MNITNEREVNTMTAIIDYANIAPDVLAMRLFTELSCSVSWRDIDENYFEISVLSDSAWTLRQAENIHAQYV